MRGGKTKYCRRFPMEISNGLLALHIFILKAQASFPAGR